MDVIRNDCSVSLPNHRGSFYLVPMKVEHVYAYVLFLFLFFFPYQPNCTELPKELRQLADIQKLRREKAVKEYRINEDGLLIRSVVELNDRNPQKDETL